MDQLEHFSLNTPVSWWPCFHYTLKGFFVITMKDKIITVSDGEREINW